MAVPIFWKTLYQTKFNDLFLFFQSSLLQRLKDGEVILGDGSYTITLEKRGYVLANAWTPESSVEHPDAVRQLAIEFARAGADITQTYTFFSDDQRLKEWHGDNVPKVRKNKTKEDFSPETRPWLIGL